MGKDHIAELEVNGFTIFRGALGVDRVDLIRSQLGYWFDKDLQERIQSQHKEPRKDGVDGTSYLFPTHQMLIEAFGKSEALDAEVSRLIDSGPVSEALHSFAGKNYRMRGYTIRRMTGELDPPPGFTWHRDNPAELGLGILLTDILEEHSAGTAFVPGSHFFPYAPTGNCLFPFPHMEHAGPPSCNFFSRILARRIFADAVAVTGKAGDAFIFNGEVWHKRDVNLKGAGTWVFFTAFFPTEFPLPVHGSIPLAAEIRAALPEPLKKVTAMDQPENLGKNTMVHRILAQRRKLRFLSLWHLAQLEARWARWRPELHRALKKPVAGLRALIGRVKRRTLLQ